MVLDAFSACYLSLIVKHSDTKWGKNIVDQNLEGARAVAPPPPPPSGSATVLEKTVEKNIISDPFFFFFLQIKFHLRLLKKA